MDSTKKKILNILIDARASGAEVSGGAIAQELGISRNSVWKAINALKADGYEIISEQSKGYRLATHTDALSASKIQAKLRADVKLTVLDSIDSTNNYAKTLPYDGSTEAITADEQSEGRGRYGRAFTSPKGTGIYLTYSFKPEFPLSEVTKVTTITAVVVHRVLSEISGEKLGIKWINDIYRDGLKICGILTEGVGSIEANFERIIVGIGINVFPANFPEELKGIAGSLADGEVSYSRNEIIAGIVDGLNEAFEGVATLSSREYLDYYREHCFVIGKDITVHQKGKRPEPAHAIGINDEYELIVEIGGVTRTLSSGEVSVRI